jgi:hypothetical protein
MAFYVGLHFWEIIATISCTNLCTFNFWDHTYIRNWCL